MPVNTLCPSLIRDRVDVDPSTECWNWRHHNSSGYGTVSVGGTTWNAHRASYTIFKGPIPDGAGYHGTCVCHKCDNKLCCNPDHLFLGTQQDNIEDMSSKGRRATGEDVGSAKLTYSDVDSILSDTRLLREIAVDYSISMMQVSRIKRGINWVS